MTWDQNSKHYIKLHLILNRATIKSLLLVREKEPPILTFINFMWPYMKFMVAFVSLPSSCKLSFILLDFNLLEKKSFIETVFFLNISHFCVTTSIFWRTCLQTRLIYNFRLPIWNKIRDRHSSKIPDQELCSRSVKCPDWHNKRQYLVYTWLFQGSR